MPQRALKSVMDALHAALADDLLTRVLSGQATPAELGQARQFLKDNGIEAIATPENALGKLADELPDFPDPQDLNVN